jgi:hypothetical protein
MGRNRSWSSCPDKRPLLLTRRWISKRHCPGKQTCQGNSTNPPDSNRGLSARVHTHELITHGRKWKQNDYIRRFYTRIRRASYVFRYSFRDRVICSVLFFALPPCAQPSYRSTGRALVLRSRNARSTNKILTLDEKNVIIYPDKER